MSLINKFFLNRNELLLQIESFEKRHNLNLLKQLRAEENEVQFLAMISEIQFGLFFDKSAITLKYEEPIQNKTPDWIINMNGQDIIAEVVRLNPSASDKEELDFEDDFMNSLEKIPVGCFLHFDYDQKTINRKSIDLQKCRYLVERWLSKPRAIRDKLILFDSIKVEIVELNTSIEHVCLAGGGGSINFDYRRLSSENSRLAVKAIKYSSIIDENALPYIICLYMDFHTWFRKDDLFRGLYGSSVQHMEETIFYSHLIRDALYYSEDSIMKNVSGVLLRQGAEYTYFQNYSNNNLNRANKEYFLNWQHPYE